MRKLKLFLSLIIAITISSCVSSKTIIKTEHPHENMDKWEIEEDLELNGERY
jgi:hypothetical protein